MENSTGSVDFEDVTNTTEDETRNVEPGEGRQIGIVNPLVAHAVKAAIPNDCDLTEGRYRAETKTDELDNTTKILQESQLSPEAMGISDAPHDTAFGFIKTFTETLPPESRVIVVPCLAITVVALALMPSFWYLVLSTSLVAAFCYLVKKKVTDTTAELRLATFQLVNQQNKQAAQNMLTTAAEVNNHRTAKFVEYNQQTLALKKEIGQIQCSAMKELQSIAKDRVTSLAEINKSIIVSGHNLELKSKEISQRLNSKAIEEKSKIENTKVKIDGLVRLSEEETKRIESAKSAQKEIELGKEITLREKASHEAEIQIETEREKNSTTRAEIGAHLAESEALCKIAFEGARNGIKYNVQLNRKSKESSRT